MQSLPLLSIIMGYPTVSHALIPRYPSCPYLPWDKMGWSVSPNVYSICVYHNTEWDIPLSLQIPFVLMHCHMGWHILLCPMLYFQSALSILSSKSQLFVSHALSMFLNPGWLCEWHDLTEHSGILDKCNQQGVAALAITFSNWTISGQFLLVYRHNWRCTVAMFGHTREREELLSVVLHWVVLANRGFDITKSVEVMLAPLHIPAFIQQG